MKKALVFISLLMVFFVGIAQNEWTLIHPYPTLNNLQDVHFNSEMEGWVVGTDGLILYTTTGGESWVTQHSNNDESFWGMFFIDENEGWVVGWNDIYHTTDKGINWEKQNTPSIMGDLTDVFFINQDTGWIVGTYKIVLITTDGGKNWTKTMNSISNHDGLYSVCFTDYLHGFAVGGFHGFHNGFLMKTVDGGNTWIESFIGDHDGYKKIYFYDTQTGWICGYGRELLKTTNGGITWVDKGSPNYNPADDIIFFNENNGLFLDGNQSRLTFDGGETWDSLTYINASSTASNISSWEAYSCFVSGYAGTMCRTLDGGSTWERLNSEISSVFNELGFFNENYGLGIVWNYSGGDLVRTIDGGNTWEYDTIIPFGEFYDLEIYGSSGYLLNKSNQMMKTIDGGENWELLNLPVLAPEKYKDFQFVNNNIGFLCSSQGVLKETNNGGQTWTDRSLNEAYNFTKMFFVNEETGWLIDHTGKNVLNTNDGGLNWIAQQIGDIYIFQPVDVFFINENLGYLITDEGILFKSIDGGEDWNEEYVFPNGAYSEIYFRNEFEGWIKMGFSVYYTNDGGETWTSSQSFSSSVLRSMFFLDDKYAWVGGGDGLIAKNDFTVDVENIFFNESFVKVYPNPGSEYVKIEVSDSDEKIYDVKFLNMQGQSVRQFSNLNESGTFEIDIVGLMGGTYIIDVVSDKREYLVKLIVK